MLNGFTSVSKNILLDQNCEYCKNKSKYVVKTNLGFMSYVCNLHLVLFGEIR